MSSKVPSRRGGTVLSWLKRRPDAPSFAVWLLLGIFLGYQRLAKDWCLNKISSTLPIDSRLMAKYPCNGTSFEQFALMAKNPGLVYRDLLWDSNRPIRWVQGQIIAVIVRLISVLIMPPDLYRRVSPWLVVAARAVAPACLLAVSWLPIDEVSAHVLVEGSPGRFADGFEAGSPQDDEYVVFSLRWYPLMDLAFNLIHPTSFLAELLYGMFSAGCILGLGLPLQRLRPPRVFRLPVQLLRCGLSTAALLAVELWRSRVMRAADRRWLRHSADRAGAVGQGKPAAALTSAPFAADGHGCAGSSRVNRTAEGGHPRHEVAKAAAAAATVVSETTGKPQGALPTLKVAADRGAVTGTWGGVGRCDDPAATSAASGQNGLAAADLGCRAAIDGAPAPGPVATDADPSTRSSSNSGAVPPAAGVPFLTLPTEAMGPARHDASAAPEARTADEDAVGRGAPSAAAAAAGVPVAPRRTATGVSLAPLSAGAQAWGPASASVGGSGSWATSTTHWLRRRPDPPRVALVETYRICGAGARGCSSGSWGMAGASTGEHSAGSSAMQNGPLVRLSLAPRRNLQPQLHALGQQLLQRRQQQLLQPEQQRLQYRRLLAADSGPATALGEGRPPPQETSGEASCSPFFPPYQRFGSQMASRAGPAPLHRSGPGNSLPPMPPQLLRLSPPLQPSSSHGSAAAQHLQYCSLTALYCTRVKIDGYNPEHIGPGYHERISQLVARAGLMLEAVIVREGCIELLVETRIVGEAPAPRLGPITQTDRVTPASSQVGEMAAGSAGTAATTTAVCASTAAAADRPSPPFSGSLREGNSSGSIAHASIASDGTASTVTTTTTTAAARGAAVCLGGSGGVAVPCEDLLDIGALILALELPDFSAGEEEDLEPCEEAGLGDTTGSNTAPGGFAAVRTYPGSAEGPDVDGAAAAHAGGDVGATMDGPAGSLRLQDPVTTTAPQPTVRPRGVTTPGGRSGSSGPSSVAVDVTTPGSGVGLPSSSSRSGPGSVAGPLRSSIHNVTTSVSSLPSVMLPYLLDVYPRVLYVPGPERLAGRTAIVPGAHCGGVTSLGWPAPATSRLPGGACVVLPPSLSDQHLLAGAGGASAAAWLQSPPSPSLAMVVSWVASRYGSASEWPFNLPSGAASQFSGWNEEHVGARMLGALPSGSAPQATAATGAAVGILRPADTSAGPVGAAVLPATSPDDTSATSAAVVVPNAQIVLRAQGEVVAVAHMPAPALAAGGGASADSGGSMSSIGGHGPTGRHNAAGGRRRTSLMPPGEFDGMGVVTQMEDSSWSHSLSNDDTLDVVPDGPGTDAPADRFSAGLDHRPVGQSRSPGLGRNHATSGNMIPGAAGTTLGNEMLYSLGLEPVLAQLRPGVVLLEARLEDVRPQVSRPEGLATAPAAHGSSVVPVLLVDDPRVAEQLQVAADNWHGAVDELDNLLHDLGALMRLQDEVQQVLRGVQQVPPEEEAHGGVAGAPAVASAVTAAEASANCELDPSGMDDAVRAHLSALACRTEMLHSHLMLYVEAVGWHAARRWLRARQQAVVVAVTGVTASATTAAPIDPTPVPTGALVAAPAPPPAGAPPSGSSMPPEPQLLPGDGPPACPTLRGPASPAPVISWATRLRGLVLRSCRAANRSAAGDTAAAPPPPPTAVRSSAQVAPPQSACPDSRWAKWMNRGAELVQRRVAAAQAVLPAARLGAVAGCSPGRGSPRMRLTLWRLWELLLTLLGWRSRPPEEERAYQVYARDFATHLMNVMQLLDIAALLTVFTRSGRWLDPDKACVLAAASTGLVMAVAWLSLSRATWRRLSGQTRWLRHVSYTFSKLMVAFMGFPQPPATLRHELSRSIFIVEGVILPAAVLMSPAEAAVLGLIRVPLCARMWVLGGAPYGLGWAMLRALFLSTTAVATTLATHIYMRLAFERRRWCGSPQLRGDILGPASGAVGAK